MVEPDIKPITLKNSDQEILMPIFLDFFFQDGDKGDEQFQRFITENITKSLLKQTWKETCDSWTELESGVGDASIE